jgi:hypothetical protein
VTFLWLLASNLVPLFGVLFFGWSLFALILAYWLENLVIGYYNWKKLRQFPEEAIFRGGRGFLKTRADFFAAHYGGFCFIHGMFVLPLLATGVLGDTGGLGLLGFVGVLLSAYAFYKRHGVAFEEEFLAKAQYRTLDPSRLMLAPYPRVVIMHLTLLGGAAVAAMFGSPLGALVILVGLKLGLELLAHRRERRKTRFSMP